VGECEASCKRHSDRFSLQSQKIQYVLDILNMFRCSYTEILFTLVLSIRLQAAVSRQSVSVGSKNSSSRGCKSRSSKQDT
jgi:hypothetical protein